MHDDPQPPLETPSKHWLHALFMPHSKSSTPQDKIREFLAEQTKQNILDADSAQMMQGVLNVADMRARDVMIPYSQIVALESGWTLEKILSVLLESGHSRFPVFDEDHKTVLGILLAKDFLHYCAQSTVEPHHPFDFSSYLRPAFFTPESKRLNLLLREFRQRKTHMAIVIDEYGSVAGLLTIEDILELIVGSIEDEHDEQEEANITPLDDGAFLVNALTEIQEFNNFFHTDWADDMADTVGGKIIAHLGYVPKVQDSLTLDGFEIRITKANKRRLIQVWMRPLTPSL